MFLFFSFSFFFYVYELGISNNLMKGNAKLPGNSLEPPLKRWGFVFFNGSIRHLEITSPGISSNVFMPSKKGIWEYLEFQVETNVSIISEMLRRCFWSSHLIVMSWAVKWWLDFSCPLSLGNALMLPCFVPMWPILEENLKAIDTREIKTFEYLKCGVLDHLFASAGLFGHLLGHRKPRYASVN